MTALKSPVGEPPFVLIMDTAGPACQAVVSRGPEVLAARSIAMVRGHGETLVPMVEETLAQAGLAYEDLGLIAVTLGPGSFTGMRIALAAARGFCAALNVPLVGIGSLEALARADTIDTNTSVTRAVSIDARNGLVYAQRFDKEGRPLEAAGVMADLVFCASLTPDTRLVGPATPIVAALARAAGKPVTLGNQDAVPSPQALVDLALSGEPQDRLTPLYLKTADAIAAKPAGLRLGEPTDLPATGTV